ncbi:hypothetical protein Q4E93_29160 [Flavitalea sp. BT771]|uniref:hypothetical protein n=1 Tax=Flavitalea sp. BT771 TaxID=3063329 RepID=UPI0026E26A03|nr:hypothetical protein [Flavitalea sp. BT771]MDO6434716.1 hypothetical protein [Flavitalea sp. BT771]MDV6223616.1 hypothetical protein [Flavitalea sp. BT771]
MKKDNLTFLQENLRYLGFGETLPFNEELEHEVGKGQKEFHLTTEAHFDEWSKLEATLHFRKGGQQEMYFLTKYTAALWYAENPDLNRMQTFYIFKGAGVTLKEAFNLLQGRAVNKDLTDSEGEKYNAWIQLDFSAKTPMNNYRTRQFRLQYGYDLEKVLDNYPIRELQVEELRSNLIRSLRKGNIHPVTFAMTNKIERKYIEACPQFKTISIYSETVRSVQHLVLQKVVRTNENTIHLTPELELPPVGIDEDGDMEKEEEREVPAQESIQADGPPVKKRNRRTA